MTYALSAAQLATFDAVIDKLDAPGRARLEALQAPAAAAALATASSGCFGAAAEAVDQILGGAASGDLRRGLIALWAKALPASVSTHNLPSAVTTLYPQWTDRLSAFLTEASGEYDEDFWAKDVRFALAMSVPATRTQVIDLQSRLGAGDVVRHAQSGRGWDVLAAYAGARAWGPWLEVHTESRDLSDFNEAGWDQAWAVSAEILKRRPDLRGMMGSSWFYDPPLEQISPRLAYLRLNPTRNGAFMIHQGPGEIHTQRAAASPGSRRTLIEKGEYTARSWIVVWPRTALLRWADSRAAQALRASA